MEGVFSRDLYEIAAKSLSRGTLCLNDSSLT